MARLARVVVPGSAHHITQRGNRRQPTFFCDEDYQYYLELMAEWCGAHQVEIWAYCLMPNHVHLIAVPQSADGLCRAIGEVHRRYTRMVNFREGWRGHLWQGRFASFVLDEPYLLTAARYVELNPIRAGMVNSPSRCQWSSAAAHVRGSDDVLVKVAPLLKLATPWRGFLARAIPEEEIKLLRAHQCTGRPWVTRSFSRRWKKSSAESSDVKSPGPSQGPRKGSGAKTGIEYGVPGIWRPRNRRPAGRLERLHGNNLWW
jgi:putative transposase